MVVPAAVDVAVTNTGVCASKNPKYSSVIVERKTPVLTTGKVYVSFCNSVKPAPSAKFIEVPTAAPTGVLKLAVHVKQYRPLIGTL
jgi:hypothetical protein